jgi:HEAT repeat protein
MWRISASALVLALILNGQASRAQDQLPKIIRALDSDIKTVRLQAVTALGNHGTGARSAARALKELVDREKEPQIALQAVQALAQVGAYPQLRALLKHPGQQIRWQAIAGLGVIGPPAKKAVPTLVWLLADEQPITRMLAAQALGEIGVDTEEDASRLALMLRDVDPDVQQYALLALMNLGPNSVPALEKMLDEEEPVFVRTASLQALANQGPSAKSTVPKLIKLLKDPESNVRAQSAAALASMGAAAKDALPTLFDNLLDDNFQVQIFSFQAAVTIGQADRRGLSASLKSANAKGRWAVPPPGKEVVPGLIKKLSEKDQGIRIAAALALGRIGGDAEPAIPTLTRMLQDEDKQVQNAARQALAQLDRKNAETYFKKVRQEQQLWLRDAKIQQAQFAAGFANAMEKPRLDMINGNVNALKNNIKAELDQVPQQMQILLIGSQKLSVATRNAPQQAYLRRLMWMHAAFSAMDNPPPEADWVRDQISNTGIEAVPAIVNAYNVARSQGIDIGFC